MSLTYFNPVELLELSSNWEKKDHRTIFHEFEVLQLNNCLNNRVMERTSIIEEYFISSMYFSPVALVERWSNWGKKDHRTIFYEFGVYFYPVVLLLTLSRCENYDHRRIFREFELVQPSSREPNKNQELLSKWRNKDCRRIFLDFMLEQPMSNCWNYLVRKGQES